MDREKLREAAQRLAERGQFDLALVEYGRLIASDPNDTRALLVSGDLQVRTGDFAAAIATYDTVARLYAEHGYADKAVAVYHQVRQLLTQHRADLLPQYAHVLAHLLALLHDLGRPNDALALLDDEANRLRAAGAELEAIDIYRRMTELAAGTPLPYLRLAEALCRTGNVDEALEAFWAAAEFLLTAGRRDDALRVIERMLHFKQDPKYARMAAELYLEKGEVPEAMQALSRLHICFQADATDLKTLALLAKAFLLINQEDKAIEVQKELARQAHEQGDKELFRATVAELHTRAPSDDQVHALSELPPPPEDKAKRRAPPKRPAPSEVAAAVDSIPAEASPQRPSSPGRPPRSRVGTPLRTTGSRVPRVLTPEQRPGPTAAEASRPPLRRPASAPARSASQVPSASQGPSASQVPSASQGPSASQVPSAPSAAPLSSDIPVSLNSLLPSEAPPEHLSARPTAKVIPQAEALDPRDESALIKKAIKDSTTYRELGLSERASEVLRQALTKAPHSIPLRERLRDLLAEAGDHNGAIEEMLLMAEVYIAHERRDHAETVLTNILELEAGHARATDLLREISTQNAEPISAEPISVEPASLRPTDAPLSNLQPGNLGAGNEQPSNARPASAPSRPKPPSKPASSHPAQAHPGRGRAAQSRPSQSRPAHNPPAPSTEYDAGLEDLAVAESAERSSPSATRASVLPPMPSLPPLPRRKQAEAEPAASALPSAPSGVPALRSSTNYSRPPGSIPGPTLDDVLEQAETLAARGQFEHAESLLREELSRLPGHPLLLDALEEIRDDLTVASRPPGAETDRPSMLDSLVPRSPRRSSFPASPGSLLAPSAPQGLALQAQLSELEAAVRDSQNPPPALPLPTNLDVDLLFEQFKEGVKAQVADNDSATHYDLGLAYKEMSLLDDAIEELQLAARDPARESVCFSTIALIYCEQKMYAKAMEFYQRGLQSPNRLPEQDINLYYELGNVNELSGELELALEYFEEVVGRNPNFRDVRDRIAKLKRQARKSANPSPNNDEDVDRAFEELLGD